MLIKRNILSVILADLKGVVVDQADYEYETIDAQSLTDRLLYLYDQLSDRQSRPIVAIGISSPGPVDTTRQMIMAPINFWGIRNLPISPSSRRRPACPPSSSTTAAPGPWRKKSTAPGPASWTTSSTSTS